ncbi:hypothetical protein IGI04_035999 [Brassica rapa subsp. trilocularis]|uniref:Uncharacterized protein n=1 Tax=Brassica rapa subsp. trilocularis TaxID=1813537 RepID=A0ABQ7LD60_BRACM|nr:hypothetical protein IGI04_035999 [Brassica rapa subsp. trilocularis]
MIIVSDRAGLVSRKEQMKSNAPEIKLSFRDLNYLPNMHGKPGKHVRKEMDLRGEAKAWWNVEKEARWDDEEPIYTWNELKIIMTFKYVPGFQWEEKELDFDFYLEEIAQPDSLPEDSLPMIASEQDGETPVICMYLPDQKKQDEKMLRESSTTPELAHALIDQGESFQSLNCGLLTRSILYFQSSLVEHLRVVKGLQQVVFEPERSLSVSRRSNNFLGQKTVSYKLDLQGSFTPNEQDLKSNVFEGREYRVILSICEWPKLQSEYGDHCARPPEPMLHKNQVKMCAGQGALRDIRSIVLLQHNGLVRTQKQAAKYLHVIGEPILLSDLVEERIHAEISTYEASVGYNKRVTVKIKLIKEKQQPDLEFVGIEQGLNHQIKTGVEKLNKPGAEKLIKLGAEKMIIVSDRAGLVSKKEQMKSNAPEIKLS